MCKSKILSNRRENDLRDMAARIKKMREILRSALELMDTPGDWSVITEQNGIYAYIPFTGKFPF